MQRIEVEAIAPLVEQGNGAYASFGWIGGLTRWWTVKDGVTRLAVEPTGRSPQGAPAPASRSPAADTKASVSG